MERNSGLGASPKRRKEMLPLVLTFGRQKNHALPLAENEGIDKKKWMRGERGRSKNLGKGSIICLPVRDKKRSAPRRRKKGVQKYKNNVRKPKHKEGLSAPVSSLYRAYKSSRK